MESSNRNIKDFEPANQSQKMQYKLGIMDDSKTAKSNEVKSKIATLNKVSTIRPSKSEIPNSNRNKIEYADDNNQEKKFNDNEIAYQNEINMNKIPRRVKNMPDISTDSKKLLEYYKLKLRKYDLSLCLLAVIVIICAILDVSLYILIYCSKNKLQKIIQ
jgi:hypothetical protein